MAMPRRVYTNTHYDYVAEVAARIVARKESLTGFKVVRQPALLRHFTCDLEAMSVEEVTT